MRYDDRRPPSGWPPSPNGSHGRTDGQMNGHPSLEMMVGRLLAQSEWVQGWAHRVDWRLDQGNQEKARIAQAVQNTAQAQAHMAQALTALTARVETMEKAPRWERLSKRWAAFLVLPGTVLATGSLDGAIALLDGLKKVATALGVAP